MLTSDEHRHQLQLGEIFERDGYVVQPNQKLGRVLSRRPPGVTTNQWNAATRAPLDFVVADARTYLPAFVVELRDPRRQGADAQRQERMKNAVCEVVGLELLRIESSALTPAGHGRRIVEYLIDARTFAGGIGDDEAGLLDGLVDYRHIVGRLPDGRRGYVNDLGAVAHAAAVEAYASRRVADPIIRGFHLSWKDGRSEGWGWLEVRDGRCLFERVQLQQLRFVCGVDPGQLAQDLAAAAIGERLKTIDTDEPDLTPRGELSREFEKLRLRRDEVVDGFVFDHITFD